MTFQTTDSAKQTEGLQKWESCQTMTKDEYFIKNQAHQSGLTLFFKWKFKILFGKKEKILDRSTIETQAAF